MMNSYFAKNEYSFSSKTGIDQSTTEKEEITSTWKLSIHPLEELQLPKNVTDKKGKKQSTYFKKVIYLYSKNKFYEEDEPQLQLQSFRTEGSDPIKNQFKNEKEPQEETNQEHEKVNKQLLMQTKKEEIKFINKNQKNSFSYSKFIKNQLGSKKSYTIPKKEDLTLIRVLTSMPNFKLQKLYRMKIETTRNVLKLKSNSPKKFLTVINKSPQGLHRQVINQNKLKKLASNINEDFEQNVELASDNEFSQQNSCSSRFLNYRIRSPKELNQAIASRIQTVQKQQDIEKHKLVVLTERNRNNLFKISDKLQQQFGVKNKPQGRYLEEDNDIKEIFKNQNKKNNFFDFPEYFYHNYQIDNRGLQIKMSLKVQQRNEQFEQKIREMIDNFDKQMKILTTNNR